MRLPIAIQLYSLRDDMEKDMPKTLRAVRDMGYDGVEFAGLFGREPEEVRRICDELSLVPVSAHVPFADMEQDPEGVAEIYHRLGCRQLVIPYLDSVYLPGNEKYGDLQKGARAVAAAAKKRGMVLCYHNHDFEFARLNGKYKLDILYTDLPAEILQTQIDTCWAKVAGENPAEYLRRYAGRCPTVHLKDFAGEKSEHMYSLIGKEEDAQARNAFEFRPCGYGRQDMPTLVRSCEECGAEWLIVEQDNPGLGKTAMECAEMSVKYLRSF